MSVINFNLNNVAALGIMAPPVCSGAASLPWQLQGIGGIYMIVNTYTINRYIGISYNLAQRFGPRLATTTEFGFAANQLNQIELFWGTVSFQDTPGFHGIQQPQLKNPPVYYAPLIGPVDGILVNFEHLLIHFVMKKLGAGGTVSNNMMMGDYSNPTHQPVTVNLHSSGSPTFPPYNQTEVWQPGHHW
jgi:hypothetical protein